MYPSFHSAGILSSEALNRISRLRTRLTDFKQYTNISFPLLLTRRSTDFHLLSVALTAGSGVS